MNNTNSIMEQTQLSLRDIYQGYGFMPFMVNKFEEYDLYVQNRDFLSCKNILTFNDIDGRLMALKPDVTLSIIKNTLNSSDSVRKVYYTENVYRVPNGGDSFSEIPQMGLECIGNISVYEICEVIILAAKSLNKISSKYVLSLSHMGILTGIFEHLNLDLEQIKELLECYSSRNSSMLEKVCESLNIPDDIKASMLKLISVYSDFSNSMEIIRSINLPSECSDALAELEMVSKLVADYGSLSIKLDFSIVNDAEYYSGFVFTGYIDGVPTSVLSGGQYDNLLTKMGKEGRAIGFAVYFDTLERFLSVPKAYDFDTLVTFSNDDEISIALLTAERLRTSGESVRVQKGIPNDLSFRHKIVVSGKEANEIG